MSEDITRRYTDAFADAWNDGTNGFARAAKIYTAAIDEPSGSVAEQLRDACPFIPASAWSGLERVGRGEVMPRLLLGSSFLCRYPISEQKKYTDDPIQVALDDGDTLSVMHYNLSNYQRRQIDGKNHVRTIAEQRAWMASEARIAVVAKSEPGKIDLPYSASKGKLQVFKPTTFDRKTLARLLSEME